MKILLILAHPNPASFNHAIAQEAVKTLTSLGHDVTAHDLYAENFEALLPAGQHMAQAVLPATIQKYCQEVSLTDAFVIIHPNWWGQPPAILKGWVDRVIRNGTGYKFVPKPTGGVELVKLLKDKMVVVFTTSDTPLKMEIELYGDPLELIWGKSVFGFCGCKSFLRKNFDVVVISKPDERAAWLKETAEILKQQFPRP